MNNLCEHLSKQEINEVLNRISEEEIEDFKDFINDLEIGLFSSIKHFRFPYCIERSFLEIASDKYLSNFSKYRSDYISWYILVGFIGHESCAFSEKLSRDQGLLLTFFGGKEFKKKRILDHLYSSVLSSTIMVNSLYDLAISAHKESCYVNSSVFKLLDKLKSESIYSINFPSNDFNSFENPNRFFKTNL